MSVKINVLQCLSLMIKIEPSLIKNQIAIINYNIKYTELKKLNLKRILMLSEEIQDLNMLVNISNFACQYLFCLFELGNKKKTLKMMIWIQDLLINSSSMVQKQIIYCLKSRLLYFFDDKYYYSQLFYLIKSICTISSLNKYWLLEIEIIDFLCYLNYRNLVKIEQENNDCFINNVI